MTKREADKEIAAILSSRNLTVRYQGSRRVTSPERRALALLRRQSLETRQRKGVEAIALADRDAVDYRHTLTTAGRIGFPLAKADTWEEVIEQLKTVKIRVPGVHAR